MAHYFELPGLPRADIVLNPARSYLSVIVPRRSVNYVFDPECLSFAQGNPTYVAVNSTIVSDANRQKRGLYSIRVDPQVESGGGLYYAVPQGVQAGIPYAFSCDHFGGDGVQFQLAVQDANTGQILAGSTFEGAGFWQRPSLTFTSGTARIVRLAIYARGLPGGPAPDFWVDGFQIEQSPFATTFFSGNSVGFFRERQNPYGWLGASHASASFRSGSTRSGGELVPLSKFGFDVYEIEGLGLIGTDSQVQRFALDHGGIIERTFYPEREFSITGRLSAIDGITDLHCARQKLTSSLSPVFGRERQPVRLGYQLFDCERPLSDTGYIDVVYTGGLELDLLNHFAEEITIDFVAPDPYIYDSGDAASELEVPEPATALDDAGLPARDESGRWALTTPIVGLTTTDLELGPDGYMYVLMNLVVSTDFLRWDGFEWILVQSFAGEVHQMAPTPDGGMFLVGDFTYSGARNIVRFDTITQTFSTLQNTVVTAGPGAGMLALSAVTFHPSGKLIVGGHFTDITNSNGTVSADNVAAYDLTTQEWEALGINSTQGLPDAGGEVLTLAVSPAGFIFAGGRFSASYGGIHNLGMYNLLGDATGWNNTDSPMWENSFSAAKVNVVRFGPDGTLWVGGVFNNSVTNNLFRDEADGGFPDGVDYHSPLTNIAYIPDAGGDVSEAIFFRLLPIEQGIPETFEYNAVTQASQIYDIDVSCDGTVHVVGFFTGGLTNQRTSAVAGGTYRLLANVAYMLTGPDHVWRLPELIIIPNGYGSVTTAPLRAIASVAVGTRCYGAGQLFPFGVGVPGSTAVSVDELGVAADFAGSVFLGLIVQPTDADYVIFPRRTVVDTGCSVEAKPIIRLRGPGVLQAIINRTTGSKIEFLNVFLQPEEILTIDLSARIPSVYSNVVPNAYNYLSNVSQLASFSLASGENEIDLVLNNTLSDDTISPDTSAWIQWRPRYETVDALCRDCSR